METLETVFSAAISSGVSVEKFVVMQSQNIRSLFHHSIPEIKEGAPAVITLFDPASEKTYSKNDLHSKCSNNAFLNKPLKGKVFGIINKERIFLPQL